MEPAVARRSEKSPKARTCAAVCTRVMTDPISSGVHVIPRLKHGSAEEIRGRKNRGCQAEHTPGSTDLPRDTRNVSPFRLIQCTQRRTKCSPSMGTWFARPRQFAKLLLLTSQSFWISCFTRLNEQPFTSEGPANAIRRLSRCNRTRPSQCTKPSCLNSASGPQQP